MDNVVTTRTVVFILLILAKPIQTVTRNLKDDKGIGNVQMLCNKRRREAYAKKKNQKQAAARKDVT